METPLDLLLRNVVIMDFVGNDVPIDKVQRVPSGFREGNKNFFVSCVLP